MAATDFTALVNRVREVLCEGPAGVVRPIPRGQFRWTTGRVAPDKMTPAQDGTVDFEITAIRNHEASPGNEFGNWWVLEFDATLSVVYAALGGNALPIPNGSDRPSLTTRAANDAIRIRAVLACPGNLISYGGAECGLADDALVWQSSESEWEEKTMTSRHRFIGRIHIEPPAATFATATLD